MSVLPLSWLISAWKNFPEFWTTGNIWKHGTKEFNSDFGCCDKVLIPKGPYSCDTHCQQLTDRDKNKNLETTVTSRLKYIYMTKASFHNQVAMSSILTSLYSSQPMLSPSLSFPKGPYSCDTHCQQLTDRHKNKNIETTVTSRSNCIYMTKASFHNQVAMNSILKSLYSSQPMLSLAEEVPGPTTIKHENANRIYVKSITDPV